MIGICLGQRGGPREGLRTNEDKRKSIKKQPFRKEYRPQSQTQVLSRLQYFAGKSASQPIQSGASVPASSIGPCFLCGQMRHLRRFCPLTVRP